MKIPPPLKALLLSRKVWLGIIVTIGAVIMYAQGAITAEQLADTVVRTAMVIIAAIAFEDGAEKLGKGKEQQ